MVRKCCRIMTGIERARTLQDIQRGSLIDANEEITKEEAKRQKMLGLSPKDIPMKRQYVFEFEDINLTEKDEEKVKAVLERIAQQRYAGKPEQYKIWETDREIRNFDGMWDWLELRYPRHFASYIDSIGVHKGWEIDESSWPNSVEITFVRGMKLLSITKERHALDEQAQQIYEQIRAGLVR